MLKFWYNSEHRVFNGQVRALPVYLDLSVNFNKGELACICGVYVP